MIVGGELNLDQGVKNGLPHFGEGFLVGNFRNLVGSVSDEGSVGGREGEGFDKIGLVIKIPNKKN